ncbi:endonuclease [Deinococcus caeni]|uniref:endonuclease n=1 Tax=Deinococcus caeni TaxID=569127 RepID=UPI003617E35E
MRSDCGRREPGEFEPAHGRGAAARATLYFLLRYPGVIRQYAPRHLQTLLAWHAAHPPGDWERHRNAAIHAAQGNRNPLIDHPDWAATTDFTEGLGR